MVRGEVLELAGGAFDCFVEVIPCYEAVDRTCVFVIDVGDVLEVESAVEHVDVVHCAVEHH